MKKVLGILGGVAVIGVMLIAMTMGKLVGHAAADQRTNTDSSEKMSKAISIANQKLPKMVDDVTRLERISLGPGNVVTYYYTVVNYPTPGQNSFDISSEIDAIKARIITNACMGTSTRFLLDQNLALIFSISDKDGGKLFDLTVHRTQCNQ